LAFIPFLSSLLCFADLYSIEHVALTLPEPACWGWRLVFNLPLLAAPGGAIRIGKNNVAARRHAFSDRRHSMWNQDNEKNQQLRSFHDAPLTSFLHDMAASGNRHLAVAA
jgi:hypothetical protein